MTRYAPPTVQAVLASPGRALDTQARADFEPRLGVDLAAVRIHDDARAAASAIDVSARAYTVGTDIVLSGGGYRHSDPAARTLLAHELAHVAQRYADRPVLRRFPSCRRLLDPDPNTGQRGPRVSEKSVQSFLARELQSFGGPTVTVERELPIPGGSAAPLRTEGRFGRGGTVIYPQILDFLVSGFTDIAMLVVEPTLEVLEVKEATWGSFEFAELQLANYLEKGGNEIEEVERLWRRRGHPQDRIQSVVSMPTSRYFPPEQPITIDGKKVLLSWCKPGVIVFKTIDVNKKDTIYCGISDKGRTDELLNRLLDPAEEAVARALARRLQDLGLGPVNLTLLLHQVRQRLQDQTLKYLQKILDSLCEEAVEVSLAAVFAELRRQLRLKNVLDGFLESFQHPGEVIDIPLGKLAAETAVGLSILGVLAELGGLVLAF